MDTKCESAYPPFVASCAKTGRCQEVSNEYFYTLSYCCYKL